MTTPKGRALRPSTYRSGLRVSVLLFAALLTACNSVIARTGLDPGVEAQSGNLYPGVRLNLKTWRCLPTVASEYPPVASAALVPLSMILLIADLPLSIAGDTLLLPLDIATSPHAPPIDWQSAPCE